MPVSEDDIRALIAECDRGQKEWISGRVAHTGDEPVVQADDMTIFGPFGGPAGWNGPELAVRQSRAAAQFQGGTGTSEVVKVIASDDLVVLVMIERNVVSFVGRDEPMPWVLRTTQVFRRDGERWIRLHRHADPLTRFRPLGETLALVG